MRYDVSVGSSGDTGIVDIELGSRIGDIRVAMEYDDAETLRDMLTDALGDIDDCRRQAHAASQPPVQVNPGWDLYLQQAFNRRAQ